MNRALLRSGALLLLLGLLTGLAIPALRNPRAGLAAHVEGVMNGMLLLLVGSIWGHVVLGPRRKKALQWLLLYGTFANWVATLLSAVLGTTALTPIAGAGFSGTAAQEALVWTILISVGLTMIAAVALLMAGLWQRVAGSTDG